MKVLLACSLFVSATAFAEAQFPDNTKTITHDCTRDQMARVMGNGNTITITGDCESIVIEGNENTFTIAKTKLLAVMGNKNTVAVDTTADIQTPGNHNTVTWKKAIGDKKKPAIKNPGTANKISQAK